MFIEYFLSIYAYLSVRKIIIGDINNFWDMFIQDTFYLYNLQLKADEEEERRIWEAQNGNNKKPVGPPIHDDKEAVEERESRFRD